MSVASSRVVVVGNGMAGQRLLAELDARGCANGVLAIGAEPQPAYNRILLSSVLAGEATLADIGLGGRDWYAARGVELVTGDAVVAIDRAAKTITLESGRRESYGKLVLATGSRAIRLNLPGAERAVAFRDLADIERLRAAKAGSTAVVIGGGLLGLEAASGLAKRGVRVALVHLMDDLMERQLDAAAARLLAQEIAKRGIELHLGASTDRIEADAVVLKDGTRIPASLVVMAVGIVPEVALVRSAGLDCGRGLRVDDFLRSVDPDIHALGECIEHRGACFGLVGPIWDQARVLADVLAGRTASYEGSSVATTLKVSGVALFSAGVVREAPGAEPLVLSDPALGVYRKLILRDGRLEGAVLYGDTEGSGWYAAAIAERRDVSRWRDLIAFGAPIEPSKRAA
jgi:nitrite reductase (NADH) large subunit